MQVQKPQAIARYALSIETEELPADFYENYIKTINAVTADDILRAANNYFLLDNIRIVIAGKGSEVLLVWRNYAFQCFILTITETPLTNQFTNDELSGITAKRYFTSKLY